MVSVGGLILASDYNSLATSILAVYGVGTGDSGYGASVYSMPNVATNNIITAAQWLVFQNAMNVCAAHQNSIITDLSADFIVGHSITAADVNVLIASAAALTTNRLLLNPSGEATLTTTAYTNTRGSAWASSITNSVNIFWADEDHARWFFNAGGEIRVHYTQTVVATSQDTDWNTALTSRVGTLTIKANSFTNSGSLALSNAFGYYQYTAGLFNAVVGAGAYSSNQMAVSATRFGFTGVRGGNGNGFTLLSVLSDIHTGGTDSVSAGTNITIDVLRSTNHISTALPSFTTNTPF